MIQYEKYHGTSNDFVIVDAAASVPDRGAFAVDVCDRDHGVGADGVLFLHLEDRYRPPRVVMTLVQPDGSTAAMCGNGARCAAAWTEDRTGSTRVMIDTQAGTIGADVDGDYVEIEMSVPTFDPGRVPLDRDDELVDGDVLGYEVTAVSTGVPHAVIFVDDVDSVDVDAVSPAIRNAAVFPEGANVTFAERRGDGFAQRTFERGVEGETQSCGTGAVAIAAAAKRRGIIGDETVTVSPPGGDLEVTIPDDGPARLAGPIVKEYAGEAPLPSPRRVDAPGV